jgi:catechol 2,3-dioxygenase-like lactoylglutathione lyase family enzyme
MSVDVLQHINLRAADIERSRDFYVNIIGLHVGPRPPITVPGYWLYVGDQAVLHLVQQAADAPPLTGGGAIDHVAFHGRDVAATRARLRDAGIAFEEGVVPRNGTRQLFVHDPDGVRIELNFQPDQS